MSATLISLMSLVVSQYSNPPLVGVDDEPSMQDEQAELQPQQQPDDSYAPQQQAIDTRQGQITSVAQFQQPLSDQGQWVTVNGSQVWQPYSSVVGADFTPYVTNGQWTTTSAGTEFASDFSFGWATFHYGRWWRAPSVGWVWYPDTTWGPSWVSWRSGSEYVGWAPLGPVGYALEPAWTFVPTQHFYRPRVGVYAVGSSYQRDCYYRTSPYAGHFRGWGAAALGRGLGYGSSSVIRRGSSWPVYPRGMTYGWPHTSYAAPSWSAPSYRTRTSSFGSGWHGGWHGGSGSHGFRRH